MKSKTKADLTVVIVGLVMAVAMFATNQPRHGSSNALVGSPRLGVQFATGPNAEFQPAAVYPGGEGGWLSGMIGSLFGGAAGRFVAQYF